MTRKTSQPEFAKVLVLSTAHLGEASATGDDPPVNALASLFGEHGWLVLTEVQLPVVHNEPVAMQVLRDILHYARRRGCAYVLFDSDGPTLEKFPTYDW